MRRFIPTLALLVVSALQVQASGLLIPEERTLPPLAMLNHKVSILLDEQVSVTRVEQTFRNHTSRQLEATYIFPVPKGASVNKLTMWIDGKEVKGEMVEAKQAREIYNSIVRRTQDPALLEYVGTNLFRMRVFPIPPNGDQKVSLSYTAVANRESGLVEYIYPLKTDGKATQTLEELAITAEIKSEHGVQNVYSPTHGISLKRRNDKAVTVVFDKKQGLLDKDFQLFYQLGDKDVGLTALTHRPIATEKGHVMMLITPKVELSKAVQVPRDVILVLDTSGSMRGPKMEQARKAMKYCIDNLNTKDRFGLINFATAVNKYRDQLTEVNADQIAAAKKWVDELEATGGTAINDALAAALEMRANDDTRTATIVFFTDGLPTIGETDVDKIMKNALGKNTASTRIFTFGVGDDVNAAMLDSLAEQTRALSTYVRPAEDIEAKVSGLYSKISHPILANVKLVTTGDVRLSETYPTVLPDLFHGQQLTVLARFTGKGPSAIKLSGQVGKEAREFVYELSFPEKTAGEKEFVEQLWARRKVGYLLDQIRVNGEKKELVDEVITLAKRYGITTPYTSYLIVPDSVTSVVRESGGPRPTRVDPSFGPDAKLPPALAPAPGGGSGTAPTTVDDFARKALEKPGDLERRRDEEAEKDLNKKPTDKGKSGESKEDDKLREETKQKKELYDRTFRSLQRGDKDSVQTGKDGVELALAAEGLRRQNKLDMTALRSVQGRRVLEVGGVWIDDEFTAKTKSLIVKAQSDAYFKLLEKHPELKDVFRLGNYIVWIAPNGTALVIDAKNGKEKLDDKEIDELFKVVKK